jgi:hypothetical protein
MAGVAALVSRDRVSLAGRITWADASAANRCMLTLYAEPTGSGPRPPVRPREYKAYISSDGLYFFENIPAGNYRLNGRDNGNRTIDHLVMIPPGVNGERPAVVTMDLQFIPPRPADEQQPDTAAQTRGSATGVGRRASTKPERAREGRNSRNR